MNFVLSFNLASTIHFYTEVSAKYEMVNKEKIIIRVKCSFIQKVQVAVLFLFCADVHIAVTSENTKNALVLQRRCLLLLLSVGYLHSCPVICCQREAILR